MRRLVTFVLVIPLLGVVAPATAKSPTTTQELLAGMVTEEVEPGVYRVDHDGYRDLTQVGGAPYWGEAVTVDAAGGVWRTVQPGGPDVSQNRYFRIGAAEEWPIVQSWGLIASDEGRLVPREEVLPDLVARASATPEELGLEGGLSAIDVEDDGTIWLLGDGGGLVRMPPDASHEVAFVTDVYDGFVDSLAVTPDGVAWLMGSPWGGDQPIEVFLRFDGTGWEAVPAPDELEPGPGDLPYTSVGLSFDVGPDGTLWTVGDAHAPHRSLARYDGSGWTILGEAEGVQPWGGQRVGAWSSGFDVLRVASDGSVWLTLWDPGEWRCGGLGRYDEGSWASFLPGACIYDFDFAPDGAVWVVAGEPQDVYEGEGGVRLVDAQTYVITSEALAGSEMAEAHGGRSAGQVATCGEGLGMLTLTVDDLLGKAGLELSAMVPGLSGPHPSSELMELIIDESTLEATASGCVEPGIIPLAIAVGEPPCTWPWGPVCGEDVGLSSRKVEYHCDTSIELLPGEDVWVGIGHVPEFPDPSQNEACPVWFVQHHPS